MSFTKALKARCVCNKGALKINVFVIQQSLVAFNATILGTKK